MSIVVRYAPVPSSTIELPRVSHERGAAGPVAIAEAS
jgi:hypothetical protein